MEQKKKIKIVIIVLAILLGLSLLALGGTLVYNKIANTTPATVTVPDNLITPDEDITKPDSSDTEKPEKRKRRPLNFTINSRRKTQRLPWAICSPATAKQNTSVCGYPITIKSPCITKPPFAPVMRN